MRKKSAALICILLALTLLFGCGGGKSPARNAAGFLLKQAACDDWAVFALARSGFMTEGGKAEYLDALDARLQDCGGVLSETKNTEYSRCALALRALGADPQSFAGFDLLEPLHDAPTTSKQGAAAIAYALLALGEDAPADLREEYIQKMLSFRLPGGGFAFPGSEEPDADITAICLQALALCDETADIENDLSVLNNMQGFSNCESTAQVIIALCALGIAPEKSLTDTLLTFAQKDGGFSHIQGGKSNYIATVQALCALSAIELFETGQHSLYDFDAQNNNKKENTCSLEVRCDELLENGEKLPESKRSLVPEDAIIYSNSSAAFTQGESAFDLLRRELKTADVHMEFTSAPLTGSVYIEGIGNLYEFDAGDLSGWMYSVDGEYLGVSSSEYILEPGTSLVFEFVCTKKAVGS